MEFNNYSKYDNSSVDLSAVYIGNILTSVATLAGMYFLVSNSSLGVIYFEKIKQYFDISSILFNYLVAINITTIIIYGYDKLKAMTGLGMRVPELILHILEGLGGSLGAILAQGLFGHKKSKLSFFKITWIIIVIQATILFFPYILKLPGQQQLIVFAAIPLALIILYFLDVVMALLSAAFTIAIAIGVVLFAYFFFSNNTTKVKDVPKYTSKDMQTIANTSTNKNKYEDKCKYYYTIVDSLNMRSKPNQSSKKVGTLKNNSKVCVTNKSSTWLYVDNKGWVFDKYLKEEKL